MRAEHRRRQLLETAAAVFARHGYRGTTTAELARAAGISEPILYRHFKNKLDLFVTLVDEVSREVIASWDKVLSEAKSPKDRLRVLLASNPATHQRGRRVYRVIFQAMAEIGGERAIHAALRRHVRTLHGFLKAELSRQQKSGGVRRDEPADSLAWLLIDAAVGNGMLSPLGAEGKTARTRPDRVGNLLAELIGK
jgi:AcrR family transcriptional regulator